MEDGDTKNSQPETPENLSRRSPAVVTDKQTGRAKDSNKKASSKKKKWGLLRHWRQAGWPKRLTWIGSALLVASGIGGLGVVAWQTLQTKWNFEAEHRPIVIHPRPPVLLQPFTCDPQSHSLTLGNMEFPVKNIGKSTANVTEPIMEDVVILEKQGKAARKPPSLDCSSVSVLDKSEALPLQEGRELSFNQRSGTIFAEGIERGDKFQLYIAACAAYWDEFKNYSTCDTYRFFTPSDNALDRQDGTPNLTCDGTEIRGVFRAHMTGHCQN